MLCINIGLVILMKGKPGVGRSTKSDCSARHSGRQKKTVWLRVEEIMTMIWPWNLIEVLDGGCSCFMQWFNGSWINAYSFVHSDGFIIKEFHFLLPFCRWQEREREEEKGGPSGTFGDKSTQRRKSSIFTPSSEEKPRKKPKCTCRHLALHVNQSLVPVWHLVLYERS